MFQILDGRTSFWQWDLGQRLVVGDDVCNQVHFCNRTDNCSLVCEVYEENGQRLVDVPNILLQTAATITVFAYVHTANEGRTKHSEQFMVLQRTKPADYVYTETEVLTVEKAVEDALQAAKESGDFKGDKGDKGDAGQIKMLIMAELPETGADDTIYLVPTADPETGNNYDEYVYQNGWEKIGGASVQVDLTDYVKKTDIATSQNGGVVKVDAAKGVGIDENGVLTAENIFVANPETTWQEIDNAYSAGKYIFYAVEAWGAMNIVPLIQQASDKTYVFTHTRENRYLYTVKVNKDNTRGIGSIYLVDQYDFNALVARVEALEGSKG